MPQTSQSPTILITGGSGGLGRTLLERWSVRHRCIAPGRRQLDLARPDRLGQGLETLDFDVLVNCAAIARPDTCEADPKLARRVNALSPGVLAKIAAERGARFVQISTDFVFDGSSRVPLTEQDPAVPFSIYGKTKRAAEEAALERCDHTLVARVSWLYGHHKPSHPDHVLAQAAAQDHLTAICDKWSVPTFMEDVADWLEHLIFHPSHPKGIFHLAAAGEATWLDWTRATLEIAADLGLPVRTKRILPVHLAEFSAFHASRPTYSVLDSAKFSALTGITPAPWKGRLACYLREKYVENRDNPLIGAQD